MEQVCFALPILEGKTEDTPAFMRELDPPRGEKRWGRGARWA